MAASQNMLVLNEFLRRLMKADKSHIANIFLGKYTHNIKVAEYFDVKFNDEPISDPLLLIPILNMPICMCIIKQIYLK